MFRFAIHDVLWLTVVVALGVGWFVENRQRVVAAQEASRSKEEEEAYRTMSRCLSRELKELQSR